MFSVVTCKRYGRVATHGLSGYSSWWPIGNSALRCISRAECAEVFRDKLHGESYNRPRLGEDQVQCKGEAAAATTAPSAWRRRRGPWRRAVVYSEGALKGGQQCVGEVLATEFRCRSQCDGGPNGGRAGCVPKAELVSELGSEATATELAEATGPPVKK